MPIPLAAMDSLERSAAAVAEIEATLASEWQTERLSDRSSKRNPQRCSSVGIELEAVSMQRSGRPQAAWCRNCWMEGLRYQMRYTAILCLVRISCLLSGSAGSIGFMQLSASKASVWSQEWFSSLSSLQGQHAGSRCRALASSRWLSMTAASILSQASYRHGSLLSTSVEGLKH